MINKIRSGAVAALLFLFLLPLAPAQITPNLWKEFIGEPVLLVTPGLIDHSYAGYKNGAEAIPDTFTQPVYNVNDYGAAPNDNASDTAGIKAALSAANANSQGGIVFFAAGQYDIFLDGETASPFNISRDNVIIRGSGAEGAGNGGTTLKMHNNLNDWLFRTGWRSNGQGSATKVKGTFIRGTKHFDVENVSSLNNRRFIEIRSNGILGTDWSLHSSRLRADMPTSYTSIRNGINIYEIHEIDYIDGDRVYVKAPVLTPLNSSFTVNWRDLTVGVGFENLHIDCNFQQTYRHLVQKGRRGILLWHTAHSWIRQCRFSNAIDSFNHHVSYSNSALGIIIDGRAGHHPGSVSHSTYCFIGLLDDNTDTGVWHGITVSATSAGTVAWEIGGATMKGPDTHGAQPRWTLFDNYDSVNHHSSGGSVANLPHHLDGYTRWNNEVDASSTFDLWAPGGYSFAVTQANLIGYNPAGGSSPVDAYVEGFGSRVTPDSLYEAQLQRRLGSLPAWVNAAKTKHTTLIGNISGQSASTADAVPGLSSTEQLLLGQLLTYDTLIFNELHNAADDTNDWLELRNVSEADISLDKWQLTIRASSSNALVPFPASTVIPAGEVLLITNTEEGHEQSSLLQEDAEMAPIDASISVVVAETFALPQTDFALILRSPTAFGDLAGNYFQDSSKRPETAPAFTVGTVWERVQMTGSGYRAEAWAASTYRNGLGSPGYQPSALTGDVNNDGVVNILDLVLVASKFGTTSPIADLNSDGTVNIQDLVLVANALNNVSAAPTAKQSTAAVVNNWLKLARQNESKIVKSSIPEGFSYTRGIEVLKELVRALTPDTTALLANYPNPFNPETWIPYQLAKAADVTLTIYASDGNLVRTLALGHRDVGMYKTRSQAVYWDGKNAFGESVASGVYFYTLTAGDFSATRKMLILK